MRHRVLKLLEDVRYSAAQIEIYIANSTEADYLAQTMLRDAIERRFEIVGEALRQLRAEAPETAARFPHLEAIIGFRNMIAHQYDDLRDAQVWKTARADVPRVRELATRLMQEERER